MVKKIFMVLLCLVVLSNLAQMGFGQETDSVRHHILLLDATAPFRIAIGNRNYFSYIQEMLEKRPNDIHKDYLPYRPDRDIVSIVFFHFPINPANRKINDKGFYTSRYLVLIQGGIVRRRSLIENFVENKRESFQELAVSPIGLSEVTVFPFINKYIKDNRITIERRVDKIYLVSLSDQQYNVEEAGLKSALESFDYIYHKNYYTTLRNYMRDNFEDLVTLKNIEKPVRSTKGNREMVYFHYYEIKLKIENIQLKLTNKVALDRIAQKAGDTAGPKIFWKGSNDICLDNPTEYSAWVEWALAPGEEGEWMWQRCDSEEQKESKEKGLKVISAGCRPKCSDDPKESKPLVQLVKKDTLWSTAEDVKRFKEEIWYRGVADINRENGDYSYPFDFRLYLTPQKVEYVSNEVTGKGESKVPYYYNYDVAWYSPVNLLGFFPFLGSWIEKTEITDDLLKEKLDDKKFCLQVKGYINKDKFSKRLREYSDAFKDKSIAELPAEVLSETSKIRAQDAENWGKWWALIIYSLFIGSIFFVHRYFVRPIKIRFNIDEVTKENNTIVLDFSSPQRKREVLATFELENIIDTLHPLKKNPRLKLSFDMNCKFSGADKVISEQENLLSILEKVSGREYKLKSGNLSYATLPDVYFNRKFEIILNLSAIKDIECDNIGDRILPFSLSLSSPEARGFGGKKLTISKVRTGTKESSEKKWNYSVNLHFKPEDQKKEILITPVKQQFASMDVDVDDGKAKKRENYVLDYTSKSPTVKLFDVEIKNNNTYNFSYPVDGMFSFKVKDSSGNPVSDVFYLSEIPRLSKKHSVSREIPIRLKKSDGQKNLNLYINFEEFPNPIDHCDYTINSYFDDNIVKALNIRIRRSKEKTEALVQILDEDEPVLLDGVKGDNITHDNSLLVHKDSKKLLPVKLKIPVGERKGIREGADTKLFTLDLRNNCNTRTGFYNWEIKDVNVIGNLQIEFEDKAIKLVPGKNSGTIEDSRDKEEEIEFCLDHTKVKNLHSYHFTFILKFSLFIWLFPKGKHEDEIEPAEPGIPKKQLDFTVNFSCFHDVKDNYLVVDFGTSAICAYYYTQYPETTGDNYFQISLQSPAHHLPSEEKLLPSIVNLRNTVAGDEIIRKNDDESTKLSEAGSEDFVELPALEDIFGLCPDSVLNSIKLLIVQGRKVVPIPEKIGFGFEERDFVYIDEDGKEKKGYPQLSSVLKSCYEHLLKNYIERGSKQLNSPGEKPLKNAKMEDARRYRKLVLTYPNVYNRSHITFLEENVFKDVFQETKRAYFENIELESESNCVLYYYLLKRPKDNVPDEENVLIIDIGAGTLDISYANVGWKEEMDVITPSHIEIVKRDGIALAGDSLDKAIALQVHGILKKFIGSKEFNYANRIATDDDRGIDSDRKLDFKKIMFDFKIKHILEFKKSMNAANDDEIVDICLGDNTKKNGLCDLGVESIEITLKQGHSITTKLINRYGRLYLGMKKKEWLSLPYLKQFKQLLINKLKAFTRELQIPGNLTIVLSGRTSLWPDVLQAVNSVFKNMKIAEDIWPADPNKKAIELKRSVILGAIQKATTWKEVEFKETSVSGIEAVRYQKGTDPLSPDSWKIETFKENSHLNINLANSSYFELGTKTSLDFVPFVGADGYKRNDYCKTDKKIKITLEKMADGKGYNFYVKTDKFKRSKGTRLRHVLTHETAFLRTKSRYWPVREVQLRETPPEQFNENV